MYNEPADYPMETQNYYQNPPATQFPPKTAHVGTKQTQGEEKVYDPKTGFLVFFDVVARIPREHRGMQIVYGGYNNGRALTDNRLVTYQDCETDPEKPEMNRVVYDIGHQVKHVQPHPSANLIVEIQSLDNTNKGADKYKSYGWTVINLFDYTYDFHSGEFKLPLYKGRTFADIDTRDINTLDPVEDTFICMRLGIPGDEIATSQYLPEKSTSDYRIPSIHQVEFVEPPIMNDDGDFDRQYPGPQGGKPAARRPAKSKAPTDKDPFYRCSGMNVFVHYVKQYPSQSTIKVGATLLEENSVVRIGHDQYECNWTSDPIDAGKVLMARWKNISQAQPDGAPIIDRSKPEEDQYNIGQKKDEYNKESEDILIPINNEVIWEHDFYKMLWDRNLRNDLFLIVTLLEVTTGLNKKVHPSSHEYTTVGYGTIKLNNPDGTIRYGTFDIPCYNPPAKIRNHDPDKRMKTTIKVTVSQPLPTMPKMLPYKNQPLKKPGDRGNPDLPSLAPPPNRPPNEAPFIPNDAEQFKNEPFMPKDGIDFYIDGGRFLPENTSYPRIIVHGYNKAGKIFLQATSVSPDIVASKSREPFYGFRSELRSAKFDPTSILIFTIDTFDLSTADARIVGHAVMPLFIDPTTNVACSDPKAKNFILQDGDYQIPIFSQFPAQLKNLYYSDFHKLEKIPCASLLIRIRKATKGEDGKIMTLGGADIEKAVELGIIDPPRPYSEGVYNTIYTSISSTELSIFEAKVRRNNPSVRELIEALFIQTKGEKTSMTDNELKKYCETQLLAKVPSDLGNLSKYKYLDVRYFSEFIPQLGISISVDILHNMQNKSFYFVIMSLAPPGRLYSTNKEESKEAISSTDVHIIHRINFDSPLKAIAFDDNTKSFYITSPDVNSIVIFETFEVKLKGTEIDKVVNVGFSCIPLFQYVEVDGRMETKEIYANTSVQQLPIFKGPPDPSFIENTINKPNFIEYIQKHIDNRNLEVMPKASLIIKIVDNQLENFYKDNITAMERLSKTYMLMKDVKNYGFNYIKDFEKNKSGQLKKQLPKGMLPEHYEAKIYDWINTHYS